MDYYTKPTMKFKDLKIGDKFEYRKLYCPKPVIYIKTKDSYESFTDFNAEDEMGRSCYFSTFIKVKRNK